MNLIDLSCHFLDETECGPASFVESLELCRAAWAEDVRLLVLTPRWKADEPQPPLSLDRSQEKLARLQKEVGAELDLKLGFVLQFSHELPSLVDRYGNVLALGGKKHLLVSLPANKIPSPAENVWSALSDRGFVVIVSQPECRPALRRQPARIESWIEHGVKFQINAASVIGHHGREVKRVAFEYLERYPDSVMVASNAHAGNGDVAYLKAAAAQLNSVFGAARAQRLLSDLPAAVLGDQESSNGKVSTRPSRHHSFLRAFGSF